MSQHINAIMEHLLLRKNKTPESSSKDESVANATEKDAKYIDTVDNAKSKSIFKNFIPSNNENGTSTNIFQNFIKHSESNHVGSSENVPSKSSEKIVDSLNNNPAIIPIVKPVVSPQMYEYKKRNSVVSSHTNGDTKQHELTPTSRTSHRKSSHDIRFRANQSLLEGDDVGKMSVVKPIKTKNIITKRETFDTLHHRAVEVSENYLIIPALTCV